VAVELLQRERLTEATRWELETTAMGLFAGIPAKVVSKMVGIMSYDYRSKLLHLGHDPLIEVSKLRAELAQLQADKARLARVAAMG
jgi:hypothetical protein